MDGDDWLRGRNRLSDVDPPQGTKGKKKKILWRSIKGPLSVYYPRYPAVRSLLGRSPAHITLEYRSDPLLGAVSAWASKSHVLCQMAGWPDVMGS